MDILEHQRFWDRFDEEAQVYLADFPEEDEERRRYGTLAADSLNVFIS